MTEFLVGVGRGEELRRCRKCGGTKLERIMSAAAISIDGTMSGGKRGATCCGRDEPCASPPCTDDGSCHR